VADQAGSPRQPREDRVDPVVPLAILVEHRSSVD
jgi:hypothetical protein